MKYKIKFPDGKEFELKPGLYEILESISEENPDPVIIDPIEENPDQVIMPNFSIERILNRTSVINCEHWNGNSRYQRWQNHVVISGDSARLTWKNQNLSPGGGARVAFSGEVYELFVQSSGKVIATASPTNNQLVFDFSLSDLEEGWEIFDVSTYGNETTAAFPIYVYKGGPKPNYMPVYTNSHNITVSNDIYRISWVPAKFEPIQVPLDKRLFPSFSHQPSRTSWWCEKIIPTISHPRRTNIDKNGILNTSNRQWYTVGDFNAKMPIFPLLDGPRGKGTIGSITHIEIGKGVNPDTNEPFNNLYVLDPWRICKVSEDGTITTLAGYRSKTIPQYWEDEGDYELVGDWSQIASDKRGFHELWGMCWDSRTLEIDFNADRIPEEMNLQPHIIAPTMFVTDTQNNRVCKLQFDPRSHATPVKITEFLTNINDPWDCVEWKNTLIVSERGDHRICQYDMITGELIRVILQGPDLSFVNHTRHVKRRVSLEEIRDVDVVGPEGLYVIDDWLYYASAANAQVKRVNLLDGQIETIVSNVPQALLPIFTKISVSDGTAGPKGTVFCCNWTVGRGGAPHVYLPNGAAWNLYNIGSNSFYRGRNGLFDSISYSSAVASRDGRIVFGSVGEGLTQLSLASQNDQSFDSSMYNRGKRKYQELNYDMTHGVNGYGYFGLKLPFGEDEDIDYYLECCGHTNE